MINLLVGHFKLSVYLLLARSFLHYIGHSMPSAQIHLTAPKSASSKIFAQYDLMRKAFLRKQCIRRRKHAWNTTRVP